MYLLDIEIILRIALTLFLILNPLYRFFSSRDAIGDDLLKYQDKLLAYQDKLTHRYSSFLAWTQIQQRIMQAKIREQKRINRQRFVKLQAKNQAKKPATAQIPLLNAVATEQTDKHHAASTKIRDNDTTHSDEVMSLDQTNETETNDSTPSTGPVMLDNDQDKQTTQTMQQVDEPSSQDSAGEKQDNRSGTSPSTTQQETAEEKARRESFEERKEQKRKEKIESIKFTAIASKERGKLDAYERKLVEGLALDPDNQNFLNMLSSHYFTTSQNVKALTLLKKVINKQPDNHKAIRQIGQIYSEQGDHETAELLIEKAISLKDDHPKYYISMVEIQYEQSKLIQAIQTMEKVLKLRPTNTDYLLTIATLYEEAKKIHLAQKYYNKVLEIDPADAHAKKGLRRTS